MHIYMYIYMYVYILVYALQTNTGAITPGRAGGAQVVRYIELRLTRSYSLTHSQTHTLTQLCIYVSHIYPHTYAYI